jgi:hypothetical protein
MKLVCFDKKRDILKKYNIDNDEIENDKEKIYIKELDRYFYMIKCVDFCILKKIKYNGEADNNIIIVMFNEWAISKYWSKSFDEFKRKYFLSDIDMFKIFGEKYFEIYLERFV